MSWRETTGLAFESLSKSIFKHPARYLTAFLIWFALLASHLPGIQVNTAIEAFLPATDPQVIAYNNFKQQFGQSETAVLALKSTQSIFNQATIPTLIALQDELEASLHYYDEIQSLVTARDIQGTEDELSVFDFLRDWADTHAVMTQEDLNALDQSAITNPLYERLLISADGRVTTFLIRFSANYYNQTSKTWVPVRDEQIAEDIHTLEQIQKKYADDFESIYITGSQSIAYNLKNALMKDMRMFTLAVVAIIAILLYLLFRRLSGVFMPLLVVITSLLSTISLMALFKQPLQNPTAILPSFVLAVGVGNAVHFLTAFYRMLQNGETRFDAVHHAMKHTALPMLLTSLTTAAGLLSFASADIVPVANLGIFAAAGVLLAFAYTIIVIPACIALLPINDKPIATAQAFGSGFDNVIDRFVSLTTHHYGKIIIGSLLVLAIGIASASLMRFSHNPLLWFKDGSETRLAAELVDSEMAGTINLELVIDTGKADGVKNIALLHTLDQFTSDLDLLSDEHLKIRKVLSLSQIVKETHRALNGNTNEFYTLPDNTDLLAQEFFLLQLSGADDLFQLTDKDYQLLRVSLSLPWVDAFYYDEFSEHLREKANIAFADHDVEVRLTGLVPVLIKTLTKVVISTAKSYALAGLVITIMMIWLLGSVKLGLISMIPNVTPLAIVIGSMYWIGAPLDMFTMLIGSIAIGLAVDDTVHFMHTFKHLKENTGLATQKAVSETLHTSGRAMLVTTCVLSLGFFSYMLSEMNNLFFFGLLTGACILLALLADFILAPALMFWVYRKDKL